MQRVLAEALAEFEFEEEVHLVSQCVERCPKIEETVKEKTVKEETAMEAAKEEAAEQETTEKEAIEEKNTTHPAYTECNTRCYTSSMV